MPTTSRRVLVKRTRLDTLTATTIAVLADKVRDDVGDFGHWLTGDDLRPGYVDPAEIAPDSGAGRNVGYWHKASGGTQKRLGILRTIDPTLHVAFAGLVSPRWVIRASHVFGWEALPAFPYRLLYRILSEYGIPDPDSYIKTGAHRLVKKRNATLASICSCGPTDEPYVAPNAVFVANEMVWRGLRVRAEAYQFFAGVVGWEHRLTMRGRLRLSCHTRLSRSSCPECRGTGETNNLSGEFSICRTCNGSRIINLPDSEF